VVVCWVSLGLGVVGEKVGNDVVTSDSIMKSIVVRSLFVVVESVVGSG